MTECIVLSAEQAARFRKKYVAGEPDKCWPWMGAHTRGRGKIRLNKNYEQAPRVALVLAGLPMPFANAMACHSCDNPACVNPLHLWWGTAKDNMVDAANKGRFAAPKTRKDQCRRGHLYAPDNYRKGVGCLVCDRERKMRWKAGTIHDSAVAQPIAERMDHDK